MAHEHVERHFTAGLVVRDAVIGLADGLTVPFALAAGLTGAIDTTWIIVVAGLAEIVAGSIAMGLGGYLAARSDAEHYASERAREQREVREIPADEAAEVMEVLQEYGLRPHEARPLVEALQKRPEAWVDFMMRFELGLDRPDPARARQSALTIGAAYVAGGLVPLLPYIVLGRVGPALAVSVVLTLAALFAFGSVKSRFTGTTPLRGGVQMLVTGGLAAGAAFVIARLFGA